MQAATDLVSAGVLDIEPRERAAGELDVSGFDVEVATDVAALEALAAEWRALEKLSGAAAVFQSHAHVLTWARHFLPEANGGARLHVAVVRRNGRAVLILPLLISGLPLLRIARLAGDPIAQYSEVLADPAADLRQAFAAALASARQAGADALAAARGAAPYADLTPFESYDAFLRSLSKKFRRGLRNRHNHIAEAGEVSFELLQGGPAAREAVAEAIDLKRKWLIQRGALSSAFVDPATRECLLDLAERADTGSAVTRLLVNGEAAAVRFGFEYRGTHFAYMSAYDPRFGKLSPGKMLIDFGLSGFRERGLTCLDMLPPEGRHKSDWCSASVAVADHTLPLTFAGRVYVSVYQERVRPALQWSWRHLPTSLRSLAVGLLVSI
jgi:CelD/BcsL family acetyltransferase involved in cellulose biosynthesis